MNQLTPDHEYIGIVLADLDAKQQGRYKVHIPELMPHILENKGIWCKNHTHAWRITTSDKGEYGSYYPLQSGTKVLVKFYNITDFNSGHIIRIISDAEAQTDFLAQDCVDPKPIKDRDEQTILFKTPKKFNVFYVNEETDDEPNTIYLIYNRDGKPERRTVYRIDESGIQIYTRDNHRIRVLMDDSKQVDGNQTEYVKGWRTKHVDGDEDLHVHENVTVTIDKNEDRSVGGNFTLNVNGSIGISAGGPINICSGSQINLGAPTINFASPDINAQTRIKFPKSCSASVPTANQAHERTHVRDLGPKETVEYDLVDQDIDERPLVVGEKCDDVTKMKE